MATYGVTMGEIEGYATTGRYCTVCGQLHDGMACPPHPETRLSSTQEGWICPRCGKVHAPWVAGYDCVVQIENGNTNQTLPWIEHRSTVVAVVRARLDAAREAIDG